MIYIRESLRNNWRTRKKSFGYTELTESEFAKVLLHYVTLKSLFITHSLYSFEPPCIIKTSLATVEHQYKQSSCILKRRENAYVRLKGCSKSRSDVLQFTIKHFHTSISCLAFSMTRLCLSEELAHPCGKPSQVTTSLRELQN